MLRQNVKSHCPNLKKGALISTETNINNLVKHYFTCILKEILQNIS